MSATNSLVVGTFGEPLEVATGLDLTDLDGLSAVFSLTVAKPGQPAVTWTAVIKDGDPLSKTLVHNLVDGDLDVPGDYLIHAVATVGTTLKKIGGVTVLKVEGLHEK